MPHGNDSGRQERSENHYDLRKYRFRRAIERRFFLDTEYEEDKVTEGSMD
jgi:hypothetical protein